MSKIFCREWRLNNLYRIIDRNSNSIKFRLNVVQQHVLANLHNRNLILKARQLGMSTFAFLLILDEVLWNQNIYAGIVSYSVEHAKHIFKNIIGHAIDTLPKELIPLVGVVQRSEREIRFNNGSSLRVDTTLRGGSYPLIVISEFGKTCARDPKKAEEVITGTLQSAPLNGKIIIESTAEGSDGFFSEMVMEAHRRGNNNLSQLEYYLFFYPWMMEHSYRMQQEVQYDIHLSDYFDKIEKSTGTKLDQQQKNWYALQEKFLGDKVKQEFPSTVEEAFLTSSDAYYFAESINKAYEEKRILYNSVYEALLPVYIAMDIGVNDLTVIIFFQISHGEVRIIDYYEDNNKGVDFYAKFLLQDKNYLYHTIFLPHDSTKRDILDTSNTYERDFRRLFSSTNTRFYVLPKMNVQLSISHTKIMINRCVFNGHKVKKLIDQCSKYRKKWSEQQGRYLEEPQENIHTHYADALRYVSQAVSHIETVSSMSGALEKHKKATESRLRRVL